ncbi:Mucin-19 [Chionoecetes opilio]|uniref:Mucin-19 n=1 Tax=Chionoecetes opilio TaxID=41210 RepID=A0A8J4Y010_CHIOP|nr:Mucin-19 [Chionoecetes opilio]
MFSVAALFLLVLVTQVLATSVPILPIEPPFPQPCCYGDKTVKSGEVVLSFQRSCFQLVCDNGKVVRRYLGEPGMKDCCEFDGQLYEEADFLTSHCMTLQCRALVGTRRTLSQNAVSSHCAVYNDPHFNSFDGYNYDFHGVCNYSLAQKGPTHYPELGVFADFEKCFGQASCLSHTTFRNDPHTVITLSNGDVTEILVNGHPFDLTQREKVYALQSADNCHPVLAWRSPWGHADPRCITLFGSSRIVLQHCAHRLDVFAHPAHVDNLDGLCGHYNDHVADDFTSRGGTVFPLNTFPLGFPTSWRTNSQSNSMCQAPCRGCNLDSTENPCTASPYELKTYRDHCNKAIYHLVNDYPHLHFHIDDCVFDLCIIAAYNDSYVDHNNWLQIIINIVKMAIHFHINTEGNTDTTTEDAQTTTQSPDNYFQ